MSVSLILSFNKDIIHATFAVINFIYHNTKIRNEKQTVFVSAAVSQKDFMLTKSLFLISKKFNVCIVVRTQICQKQGS